MQEGNISKLDISIIVVTWNGLALLKQTLDSLVSACDKYQGNTEIILVDNNSRDRTLDVVADFYPNIITIPLDINYGFSRGCNIGAKKAKYNYLFFFNNDIIIKDDFFVVLSAEFTRDTNTFSLSPQTNYWNDEGLTNKAFSTAMGAFISQGDFIQHWGLKNFQSTVQEYKATIYGTGAALLVDGSKFRELGGFCELFSPAYWEDVDICYNAWKRGWSSYYTSQTIAWHKISATSASLENNFKERLMLRNFFLFYALNVTNPVYLLRFIGKTLLFMMSGFPRNNERWKVPLSVLKMGVEILKLKWRRIRSSKISDREVIKRTSIEDQYWESPANFDLKLKN